MNLIQKYNVAAPRYTSYPTVPYWDTARFTVQDWEHRLQGAFRAANEKDGISLYIHLPFCESLCMYCGCNKHITVNHAVEAPYIRALLKEWQLYLQLFGEKPRIREIHLGGGTPAFFSPGHLAELLDGIYGSAELLPDAVLGFEAHPNNTTPAHLEMLYSLGFRRISLGVQDLDERVQYVINRIQPYETLAAVVHNARAVGFSSIGFDLIYGLPLQTPAGMESTVQQVMQLQPDSISFYSYAHVPWIKGVGQRRFSEADLPADDEKRALYELGKRLFTAHGYTEIGMDHFALPGNALHDAFRKGSLHRNFMGYTAARTSLLLGLGASAISDCWNAYAQNEKNVAAYQQMVNNGALPAVRGHLLDAEDLLLRRHIQALLCRFETSWEPVGIRCIALQESMDRLRELEKDGLVEIRPGRVQVTPEGRPFIRNIGMAFDARLWRKVPEAQLFSTAI
ncbi:oxygen-independent coproporphyrinogen III oxidase [Chitinophaga japonensis]|uniref:Coproporphyrinogen-III oxidase n=1 Tax=Chitinophaga japonensis TaxID=104662 RepID=A0A562SS92_CHIJA|nr:oxygen-independent coproporphyrinogen III oxidase [Chitinophaga japonensis]TWI84115.1 oxygen-independent coproporphyrinogen-3 oxidase [Chitinophaga japonensis]